MAQLKCGEIFITEQKQYFYFCIICKQKFDCGNDYQKHYLEEHFDEFWNSNEDSKIKNEFDPIAIGNSDGIIIKEENEIVYPGQEENTELEEYFNPLSITPNIETNDVPDCKEVLPCNVCGKLLTTEGKLLSHMKAHKFNKSKNTIQCKYCSKCFSIKSVTPLKQHELLHKHKVLSCNNCGKEFPTIYNVKRHMREHCKQPLQSIAKKLELITEPNDETCEVSGEDSDSQNEETISSNKTSICNLCGKEFPNLFVLSYHVKVCSVSKEVENKADDENLTDRDDEKKCGEKDDDIKNKTSEKDGIDVPQKVKTKMVRSRRYKYSCTLCEKKYVKLYSLSCHMKTHSGSRAYKCQYCPAAFELRENLKEHQELHADRSTGDNNYPCTYKSCDKVFKNNMLRRKHIKYMHIRELSHQCEQCGIKFITASQLSFHKKKRHLPYEDRKHRCNYCDKKFVLPNHLRDHINTHTGARPYKCNQCDSRFNKKSGLREHLKLHTGLKSHVCNICGMAFAQLSGYATHKKTHKLNVVLP